jgi:hypothetical protein
VISMGHRMALSNIVLYRACKKITNIFRRGRVRGPAEVWAGPLSGARESGRRQGSTILPGSSWYQTIRELSKGWYLPENRGNRTNESVYDFPRNYCTTLMLKLSLDPASEREEHCLTRVVRRRKRYCSL